jgi:hypothetical protein
MKAGKPRLVSVPATKEGIQRGREMLASGIEAACNVYLRIVNDPKATNAEQKAAADSLLDRVGLPRISGHMVDSPSEVVAGLIEAIRESRARIQGNPEKYRLPVDPEPDAVQH